MKNAALGLLVLASLAVASDVAADVKDETNCLEVQVYRGDRCNQANSLRVTYWNKCDSDIYGRLCIKESNGTWTCSVTHNIIGDQRVYSNYVCRPHPSNAYRLFGCEFTPTDRVCGEDPRD